MHVSYLAYLAYEQKKRRARLARLFNDDIPDQGPKRFRMWTPGE
ncbi:hypothetical protein Aple_101540 [Acrocarpospora pleiomorpha]|uniref:Uncharacterized protein n=1 Tax=Acrocarpospora pleiomorpha TaxID=90975 RepID=A0A5M3Y1R2_9ACTN|nr:hypothetical protein [Acrocarpospora pleiomorpha]GES27254.1 hypothetical protein Aple_101540 [Acrocarpospora pleiomorpha]